MLETPVASILLQTVFLIVLVTSILFGESNRVHLIWSAVLASQLSAQNIQIYHYFRSTSLPTGLDSSIFLQWERFRIVYSARFFTRVRFCVLILVRKRGTFAAESSRVLIGLDLTCSVTVQWTSVNYAKPIHFGTCLSKTAVTWSRLDFQLAVLSTILVADDISLSPNSLPLYSFP